MAIDFGDVLTAGIGELGRQLTGFAGSPPPVLGPYNPAPLPAQVTVDTRTGQVTKCKRRRRRRLLTPTDLSDLAALQALVGKGSTALNMAVAKAVRR